MSFRANNPVRKSRKQKCCEWCGKFIEIGQPCVYVSGYGEDFYTGRFHPECWRVEINEWWKTGAELWPIETMKRGSMKYPEDEGGSEWSAEPVSKEEAAYPYKFVDVMQIAVF